MNKSGLKHIKLIKVLNGIMSFAVGLGIALLISTMPFYKAFMYFSTDGTTNGNTGAALFISAIFGIAVALSPEMIDKLTLYGWGVILGLLSYFFGEYIYHSGSVVTAGIMIVVSAVVYFLMLYRDDLSPTPHATGRLLTDEKPIR